MRPSDDQRNGSEDQATRTVGLEHHLTELRTAIDSKYVYKYSKLVFFFADRVAEGKLDLQDLRGLSEDKLRYIRRYAESSAA